uniref:Novel immune-type receptor 9 n=1 Tax=Scleropages formosus TaxID=113540 RepID=A0A8C9SAQ0_SCLFO
MHAGDHTDSFLLQILAWLFCILFLPDTALAHVVQPNVLMKVRLGDTVTLRCIFNSSQLFYMSWYKQPFGQKPRLMVQAYSHSPDSLFQEEFKNVARFSLQHSESSSNLTISKTELSDSAVYYCASLFFNENCNSPFTRLYCDSVTLQCTVDGETCAGEHSVYWFRHGSGESLPGLIYTHGNRRDECEKSPEAGSPTHSCVYSLPKRNLSRSDAGIYYCAVATCGNILFGNGTKINMEDEQFFVGLKTYLFLYNFIFINVLCSWKLSHQFR